MKDDNPPAARATDQDHIRFSCDKCNQRLKAPPAYAGKVIKCPKCGKQICVPGVPTPPPTAAPAPASEGARPPIAGKTPARTPVPQGKASHWRRVLSWLGVGDPFSKRLPKPIGYYVYGNGFVPTEEQIYSTLRALKAKYPGIVTDAHIVGIPTRGEASYVAFSDSSEFTQYAEFSAFMDCHGDFWDSLLVEGGRRGALILVAMWDKAHAEAAQRCLRRG